MPFNGSGVFVRIHRWVADKANSINITASEVDAEDDGFAAGLSNAVCRDGQGPMSVDFLPNVDNTLNLGTSGLRWASINNIPLPPSNTSRWTYYPRTQAEITASVTPVDYTAAPGAFSRYGMDPTGATDSSPGLTAAIASNASIFDDFPGGGGYSFHSSVILIPSVRIQGASKTVAGTRGTVFTLATVAGLNACILHATAFCNDTHVSDITFTFQTFNVQQFGVKYDTDCRSCSFDNCAFIGLANASTAVVGMQFLGGGTETIHLNISRCYFSSLLLGVDLQVACTTVHIDACEFNSNTLLATCTGIRVSTGPGGPTISRCTFQAWNVGILSNGVPIRQNCNWFEGCVTWDFEWIPNAGNSPRLNCSSYQDYASGSANASFPYDNVNGCHVEGGSYGDYKDTATLSVYRGIITQGLAVADGLFTRVAYSAGNFTGSGTMTVATSSGIQKTYSFSRKNGEMTVVFTLTGATVGGTLGSAIQIAIPGGLTPTLPAGGSVTNGVRVQNGGTWAQGFAQVLPTATLIQVFCDQTGGTAWTAGSVNISGQITFPIVS